MPGSEDGTSAEGATDPTTDAQRFYSRWARLYDLLARHTPGIGSLRDRFVADLAPEEGWTVLDMGCGTGATLPSLRRRVGSSGMVLGLDYSPGVLARAARSIDRAGWENVHVVRADATAPPVAGPIDALVATFVVGMLPDPAQAVEDWCRLVEPGGRIGLVNAARSERGYGPLVNGPFRGLVWISTPRAGRGRFADGATATLDRRVERAHRAVRAECSAVTTRTTALGIVRTITGTVEED